MFGRRDSAIIFRIIALHAGHKGNTHLPRQERVFAVGLLAATPARIAEDIDIRRPEIEPLEKQVCAFFAHRLFMLDATLDADDPGHLVNGRRVEGGRQSDRLWKFCHAIVNHAVQRLAPPVVGGDIESGNGAGLVDQLRGFLFQRHTADQIPGPRLGRKGSVQIGRRGSFLRVSARHKDQAGECSCPSGKVSHKAKCTTHHYSLQAGIGESKL